MTKRAFRMLVVIAMAIGLFMASTALADFTFSIRTPKDINLQIPVPVAGLQADTYTFNAGAKVILEDGSSMKSSEYKIQKIEWLAAGSTEQVKTYSETAGTEYEVIITLQNNESIFWMDVQDATASVNGETAAIYCNEGTRELYVVATLRTVARPTLKAYRFNGNLATEGEVEYADCFIESEVELQYKFPIELEAAGYDLQVNYNEFYYKSTSDLEDDKNYTSYSESYTLSQMNDRDEGVHALRAPHIGDLPGRAMRFRADAYLVPPTGKGKARYLFDTSSDVHFSSFNAKNSSKVYFQGYRVNPDHIWITAFQRGADHYNFTIDPHFYQYAGPVYVVPQSLTWNSAGGAKYSGSVRFKARMLLDGVEQETNLTYLYSIGDDLRQEHIELKKPISGTPGQKFKLVTEVYADYGTGGADDGTHQSEPIITMTNEITINATDDVDHGIIRYPQINGMQVEKDKSDRERPYKASVGAYLMQEVSFDFKYPVNYIDGYTAEPFVHYGDNITSKAGTYHSTLGKGYEKLEKSGTADEEGCYRVPVEIYSDPEVKDEPLTFEIWLCDAMTGKPVVKVNEKTIYLSFDGNVELGFMEQSPAMPEGQTTAERETVLLGTSKIYSFTPNQLSGNAALRGCTSECAMVLYSETENRTLYSANNGNPIDLKNYITKPGRYYIMETVTVKHGSTTLGTTRHMFPFTVVSEAIAEVYVNVPVPYHDKSPEHASVSDESSKYAGSVSTDWRMLTQRNGQDIWVVLNSSNTFAVDRTYRCTLTLAPNPGHHFTEDTKVYFNSEEAAFVGIADDGKASFQQYYKTEIDGVPVLFTPDSYALTGRSMTVNLEKMAMLDDAFMEAYFEGDISVDWYLNSWHVQDVYGYLSGELGYNETIHFSTDDSGKKLYAAVTAGGKTYTSKTFTINSQNFTVSFMANGGSGETAHPTQTLQSGVSFTLPECGFTAPEGKAFHHWEIDGKTYYNGDKITITDSITLIAVWAEQIGEVAVTIDAPMAAFSPDFTLDVPAGAHYSQSVTEFTVAEMWRDVSYSKNMTEEDTFRPAYTYLMTVTLAADEGYAFLDASKISATVNGGKAVVQNVQKGMNFIKIQYSFTAQSPATTLSGSKDNGISVTVTAPPSSCILIVGRFSGDVMLEYQMKYIRSAGTYSMDELTCKSGSTYKAFLLNGTTYAPLCASQKF